MAGVTEWITPPEDPLKTKLVIIQLIYGVPSFLIMSFLLVYLGCSKKYKSSFYRLVQVDLFTNMMCWLNTWISVRSSEIPFGTVYVKFLILYIPWIYSFSVRLLNFFFHMQFLSAIWMSAHRITSILYFNNYEKFWSRYHLLIAVLFCGYSSLQQLVFPWKPSDMILINDTLYRTFDKENIGTFVTGVNIFSVIYFILLIAFGISVRVIASKKFPEAIKGEKVSKKLTRIAFVYGIVYSGILFWTLVRAFQSRFKVFPEGFDQVNRTLLPFASDMMTLALPYILLIFDSNIKRDLRPGKELSSVSPMIIST